MITTNHIENRIVERILYYQDKRGTPDVRLFTAADMTRPTWKKRTRDYEGSFTIREIIAICDVLGVKLSDLLTKAEATAEAA